MIRIVALVTQSVAKVALHSDSPTLRPPACRFRFLAKSGASCRTLLVEAANSSDFLPSKEFLPKSELVFSQLFATIPLVFTFDAKRD